MPERLIDRLHRYLNYKGLSAYAFEKSCGLSNGYLGKQTKGKGTIGSDILEKIYCQYLDLSLIWLITGEGKMIEEHSKFELQEDAAQYVTKDDLVKELNKRIQLLEEAVEDKKRIIELMNQRKEEKE